MMQNTDTKTGTNSRSDAAMLGVCRVPSYIQILVPQLKALTVGEAGNLGEHGRNALFSGVFSHSAISADSPTLPVTPPNGRKKRAQKWAQIAGQGGGR